MAKYTKRQYQADIAANEAAMSVVKQTLQSFEDKLAGGADITELSDAWNRAHDQVTDLENERRDIKRRFSCRNWTWQDHSFAALVSANCD